LLAANTRAKTTRSIGGKPEKAMSPQMQGGQ